jgi:hypothetical protein
LLLKIARGEKKEKKRKKCIWKKKGKDKRKIKLQIGRNEVTDKGQGRGRYTGRLSYAVLPAGCGRRLLLVERVPAFVPLLPPPQSLALAVVRHVGAIQDGHSGRSQLPQPPAYRPDASVLGAANTRSNFSCLPPSQYHSPTTICVLTAIPFSIFQVVTFQDVSPSKVTDALLVSPY